MRGRTVIILALVVLAGVAGGVQLGRSAVAGIGRPPAAPTLAFRPAPDRSLADAAVSAPVADAENVAPGCPDCRVYPEEYHPRHDPAVDVFPDPPAPAPDVQAVPEVPRAPAIGEIDRYTGYPVAAPDPPATPQ